MWMISVKDSFPTENAEAIGNKIPLQLEERKGHDELKYCDNIQSNCPSNSKFCLSCELFCDIC
jgi:hypothetical protein